MNLFPSHVRTCDDASDARDAATPQMTANNMKDDASSLFIIIL